jgi:hypothetical protein
MVSLVQRESPLKVAKPVTSRIHIGKDNDTSSTQAAAQPASAQPVSHREAANPAP